MITYAPIPLYPEIIVSNCGTSVIDTLTDRPVTISYSSGGYRIVIIPRQNQKKEYLHRLVLMAHAGMPEDGQIARHLDGNAMNNNIENLAWGTPRENSIDALRHGTARTCAFVDPDMIRDIRRRYHIDGMSQSALAAVYGVSQTTIGKIVRFDSWQHVISEDDVEVFRVRNRPKMRPRGPQASRTAPHELRP